MKRKRVTWVCRLSQSLAGAADPSYLTGRAILTILQDVDRWRGSEELYQKEALGADPATDYENLFYGMRLTDGKYLTWGMFLNVYSKWHIRLTKVSWTSDTS